MARVWWGRRASSRAVGEPNSPVRGGCSGFASSSYRRSTDGGPAASRTSGPSEAPGSVGVVGAPDGERGASSTPVGQVDPDADLVGRIPPAALGEPPPHRPGSCAPAPESGLPPGASASPPRPTHRWGLGAYVIVEAVFVGVSLLIGFTFLGRAPVGRRAGRRAGGADRARGRDRRAHHPAAGQRSPGRPRAGVVVARRPDRARVRVRRARHHDPGVGALRRAGRAGAGELGGRRRLRRAAGRTGRRRPGVALVVVGAGARCARRSSTGGCCGGRWSATPRRGGCRSW